MPVPSEYKFLGTSLKTSALWLLGLFIGLPIGGFLLLDFVQDYVPGGDEFLDWLFDPSGPAKHYSDLLFAWVSETAPRVFAWVSSTKAFQGVFWVVFAPGAYAAFVIWNGLLRQTSNPFQQNPGQDAFFLFVMLGVTWVVWSAVLTRGLFYLGRWDPFQRSHYQGRRWVLMGLVKLRDIWDIVTFLKRRGLVRWAGFIEVLSNRFLAGDVFLGRPKLLLGGMLRPIGLRTEKHMVTIGGAGSGKSTAALIPNLCVHEGSLLCIDPNGKLAAVTARRRGPGGRGVSGMGQMVHVLDPFGIMHEGQGSTYNVFDEIARVAAADPDGAVSCAGKVAEALVLKSGGGEQYWDDAARTLLRGLVLYMFVREPSERKNLGRLRELVLSGDVEGHREALAAGEVRKEDAMPPFDVLQEKMLACRSGPYGREIAGAAEVLRTMGARQRDGVISTAQEHTAFLDAPELQRVSAGSDFLLDDLRRGRMSVYVCLPPNMIAGTARRWVRLLVLMFIDVMQRANTPVSPPVLLAIDEFPSLGRLDGIEAVAPVLRSYGVRFWATGQTIEQFRSTYPDCWNGFISGAGAVQFMGVKDPATVEFVMDLVGAPVAKAQQVMRLLSPERNNQIIWRGDKKRPMLLKTAPYVWYLPRSCYEGEPGRERPSE